MINYPINVENYVESSEFVHGREALSTNDDENRTKKKSSGPDSYRDRCFNFFFNT